MMDTAEYNFLTNHSVSESESGLNGESSNEISFNNNVTSFENISFFIATHKYPNGLNLNQKRTLRKAATNFSLFDNKLYYVGKSKTDKRLVILDENGKKQVFEDCHGSATEGDHGGQKKTLEKIESFFFWRGMVKDVVNWIAACEICRQKEERRIQLQKKVKTSFVSETLIDSPYVCQDDDITCNENLSDDLYEVAKHNMEKIQVSLKKIQHYEKEILNMSKKADLDIDDVLDFLLAKIMKLISRKKREMKVQVEEKKTKSLNLLKTARKQLEGRFKTARKFVLDMEKANNDNQSWPTLLNKSAITASLPEVPVKEDLGGIWSVFHADDAHAEIEKIVMSCGTICEQPPYKISNVLQLPASLRLNISLVQSDHHPLFKDTRESSSFTPTRNLRFYHCLHNPAAVISDDSLFPLENQIQTLKGFRRDTEVFLNYLQTHQVYAIYISYREEGSSDWSPWSFPFLTSTEIPDYSWGMINSDWQMSSDHRETTKIVDSPTPLYSSTAQYFPGCRISFTLEEVPNVLHADDGFALIDQWVQGGTLNQEGTLFVNVEGKIFVDGKFVTEFDPLSLVSSTLTFDCHPRIETVSDGIRMELTISCHKKSHLIYWSVRNHITNVYFGVRFHQPGARVKVC